MVMRSVPIIQEPDTFLSGHTAKKIRNLCITVNTHSFSKQRMSERVCRIILSCIILTDDRISNQVKKQTELLDPKVVTEQFRDLILIKDSLNNDI